MPELITILARITEVLEEQNILCQKLMIMQQRWHEEEKARLDRLVAVQETIQRNETEWRSFVDAAVQDEQGG